MNAQRWLGLALALGIVGIIFAGKTFVEGRNDEDEPTATPNPELFVLSDEPTEPSPLISDTSKATPTVDPIVVELLVETGIERLGVGDDPYVILAGDFHVIDELHQADGIASIYKIGDKTHALRLEPFSVTPGPDLHVILSMNETPRTSTDALLPSHLDLGLLKALEGAQNYDIPDSVVITRYKSVVIYSVSLNLVFSEATLAQVRG